MSVPIEGSEFPRIETVYLSTVETLASDEWSSDGRRIGIVSRVPGGGPDIALASVSLERFP